MKDLSSWVHGLMTVSMGAWLWAQQTWHIGWMHVGHCIIKILAVWGVQQLDIILFLMVKTGDAGAGHFWIILIVGGEVYGGQHQLAYNSVSEAIILWLLLSWHIMTLPILTGKYITLAERWVCCIEQFPIFLELFPLRCRGLERNFETQSLWWVLHSPFSLFQQFLWCNDLWILLSTTWYLWNSS